MRGKKENKKKRDKRKKNKYKGKIRLKALKIIKYIN